MSHKGTRCAVRAAVLFTICVAYANSFHNGFHFDDFHTVVDNPAIRRLRNVPHFFIDATTFSVLPPNRTYRPMVSASLALDYALGHGYSLPWFHVGTFALFMLLVLLLEALYRAVMEAAHPSSANRWLACCAAAWFGLHPAMAETVNYIIQRGDLYCTLGVVAGLVIFARWPRARRSGLYLLPVIFALLSKPPAAVFPVLLFFYVYFFGTENRRARSALAASLPSIVVVSLLLWLQTAMTPRTFLPSTLSPWEYRVTQPFVWLRYVGEFFLPIHLNVDSDLAPLRTFDLRLMAGLLFFVLLCVGVWYTAQRRRTYPIAYGLIWFLVTQAPTSLYALSEVENDHRMFFSFVGLVLAAVWTVWLGSDHLGPRTKSVVSGPFGATALVILLLAYGYGVHVRNYVWLNEETLWRDDIEKCPRNGRGLMIYGLTQMNKGEYEAALQNFNKALTYTPNYATLEVNLGIVTGAIADTSPVGEGQGSAEAHFQRAISLAPGDDAAHAFYGRWLTSHGRAAEGIAELKTAVALNPTRPMQRDELIAAYATDGDVVRALEAARQALTLMPQDTLAQRTLAHPPVETAVFWINLSLLQYQGAHYAESIESARRALRLNPNSAEAYNNLGAASAALHQWDAAIAADQRAIELMPGLQLARNNLAWARAQKTASQ